MTRLLFVINDAAYFFSHRLAMAQAAQQAGYEIHVAVPTLTEEVHETFLNHKMAPYAFSTKNEGISEFNALTELNSIVKDIAPELVHLVTLKSSLRWFLLLPFVKNIKSVHTIAGFGQLAGPSLLAKMGKGVMKAILAIQSRLTPSLYVAQNPSDAAELCRQHIIRPRQLHLVQGSGVNTFQFAPSKAKAVSKTLRIGTACRRLTSKGLPALAQVARLLKEKGVNAEIHVASVPAKSGHSEGISDAEWQGWVNEGLFIDEGAVDDMPAYYSHLDAFIYLSTSGEGLAKTLLEAAASGLPIITTAQPGCKEAVIPGQSGFVVDPSRPEEAVQAIETLINEPQKAKDMGQAGRDLAVTHFSDEIVTSQMLKLYEKARAQ